MAELGALSLRIEEQGGDVVLQKLRRIDDAARLTGVSADGAAGALKSLGISAKVVGGNIQVAEREVSRASSIVKQLGSDARVTAGEVDKLAAKTAKLTGPRPFLGPALPNTTTAGAAAASSAALARAEGVASAAIAKRIALLTQGARLEATRASAIQRLIGVEAGLTAALTRGNLTQEQRIRLNVLLARTQAGVASGTENVVAAQTAKAIADQRSIDAAERQAYAMERQRVAADKMSPRVRTGASAIAALAIAATTGGGSLAGMATQAGLVGSVMAAEFAPAKWAGYAAGIGAAVIAVTALVGILAKLRAEQAKPSGLVTQRIADIRRLEDAEAEYNTRREAKEKARAVVDELREKSGGSPSVGLTRQAAELRKAEALETEALKKLQTLRNAATIAGAELTKAAIVQAAEATRTVRLSELAKDQAAVDARFQEGTASLAALYEQRRKVIVAGAEAERVALQAARAQKMKPVAGETTQEAEGRRLEASAISAEIQTLATETAARLTALDAQRVADERALVAKLLAYQAALEAVHDRSFEKRRTQILAEGEERRRLVLQAGGDEAAAIAARDELVGQRTTELLLQKAQTDLTRLQTSLDTERQRIANDLAAGKLSELEASQQVADAERSAVPEMERLVNLALQFATALGDDGAVAAIQKMRAELQGLGIDLLDPVLVAKKQVQSQLDSLGAQLGSTFADAIAAAASGGSGKNAVLRGLGGIFSEMGRSLIAYGAAMMKLLPAFSNPITSGPAAIAAGALLVALGGALGGAAGGRGGGGSTGGSFSAAAATPLSIQRLVIDPNAGVRQRIAEGGTRSVVGEAKHPLEGVALLSIDTPSGKQLLTSRIDSYRRRGG